jgi:hypothetical protein
VTAELALGQAHGCVSTFVESRSFVRLLGRFW